MGVHETMVNLQSNKTRFLIGLFLIGFAWVLINTPQRYAVWKAKLYTDAQERRFYEEAQCNKPAFQGELNAASHLDYQDLLRLAGEERDLERLYTWLHTANPNNPTVAALAARVCTELALAQTWLDTASRQEKTNLAVLATRIETLLAQGKALDALPQCEALPEDTWRKPYYTAKIYQILGDTDQTLENYQQAVEAQCPLYAGLDYAAYLSDRQHYTPNLFHAWPAEAIQNNPLAQAYQMVFSQVQIQALMQILPSAVRYNPEALVPLAHAALRQSDLYWARRILHWIEPLKAEQADYYFCKGWLAQKEGNEKGAHLCFSEGIDGGSKPHSRLFHARLGTLLLPDQPALAQAHWRQAYGELPDRGELLRQAGLEALAKKEYPKTIQYLVRARSLYPRDADLLDGLIQAYTALGEETELMNTLRDTLNLNLDNIPALDQMAQLYLKQDNLRQAVSLYNTYKFHFPHSGIPYLRAAQIYIDRGETDYARGILQTALQNNPELENLAEIEAMLSKLP
jgi:Tfp pilus assembly protein PilF